MFGIFKNNLLNRKKFLNFTASDKIWSKTLTIEEISNLLSQLKQEISKYNFVVDNNFIMNGRRTCLKDMIYERFNNSNNRYEENIKESLFNLWEFISDEYDGNLLMISRELNIPIKELDDMCEKYRKKNIICLQEKDVIIDIINKIESYIDEMRR